MNKIAYLILGSVLVGSALTAGCGDDETGSGGSGSTTGNGGDATATTGTNGNGGNTTSTGNTGGGGSGTGGTGGGTSFDCDTYCASMLANCTGENAQYGDAPTAEASCLAVCASFPVGEFMETANSLGCRAYHAGAAATLPAADHCPHAGPSGGDLCGDQCDAYCNLQISACSDNYADKPECMTACAALPAGDPASYDAGSAPGTTTLDCYLYHATAGATDPNGLHCGHSVMGGGQCEP